MTPFDLNYFTLCFFLEFVGHELTGSLDDTEVRCRLVDRLGLLKRAIMHAMSGFSMSMSQPSLQQPIGTLTPHRLKGGLPGSWMEVKYMCKL